MENYWWELKQIINKKGYKRENIHPKNISPLLVKDETALYSQKVINGR